MEMEEPSATLEAGGHQHDELGEVTQEREIRGMFLYEAGGGAFAASNVILFPLLVVGMAKYEASRNPEWIEWRHVRLDGDLCGVPPANGTANWIATGAPYPIDSPDAYTRPVGYDDKCMWFPVNTRLPGLGVDYTSILNYCTSLIILFTALALLLFGPFADFELSKRKLLLGTMAVWGAMFAVMVAVGDTALYWISGIVGAVSVIVWNWGVKACLHAYLPILASSHYELRDFDAAAAAAAASPKSSGQGAAGGTGEEGGGAGGAEAEDKVTVARNHLFEAVSGRIALVANASFLAGQLIALCFQFAILVSLLDTEDPSDNTGIRMAILFGGGVGMTLMMWGVFWLKPRVGPPFPPGPRLKLGARRSIHAVRVMRTEMPQLLRIMVGRTVYWVAISTFIVTATLFLEREFASPPAELVVLLVIFFLVGAPATWGASRIIKAYPGITKSLVCYSAAFLCLMPLYYVLALKERWELVVFIVICGVLIAPWAACVRTLMTEVVPVNYSATIMSLDGVMEFCTSWVGPLIVGVVIDATDKIRWGTFCMIGFQLAALPILWGVDMEEGRRQRAAFEANQEHHGFEVAPSLGAALAAAPAAQATAEAGEGGVASAYVG